MESRVISIRLTPKGRMAQISLANGVIARMSLSELRCRDIRVGDTVNYSENF